MSMQKTVNEEAMRDSRKVSMDITQPDYVASKGDDGAYRTQPGIPVKAIGCLEFPRVVYLHPNEPYRKIEHRNAQHEIVDVETVPAEHLSKVVHDEAELKAALKDGWKKEPYLAPPPPDPNANLYAARK